MNVASDIVNVSPIDDAVRSAVYQGREFKYNTKLAEAVWANLQGFAHSNFGPFAYTPDEVFNAWKDASSDPIYQSVIQTEIEALDLVFESLVNAVKESTVNIQSANIGIFGSGTIEQTMSKEGFLIKRLLDSGVPISSVHDFDSSTAVLEEFETGAHRLFEEHDTTGVDFDSTLCNFFENAASKPVFPRDASQVNMYTIAGFTSANLMVPWDAEAPPLKGMQKNLSSLRTYMEKGDFLTVSFNHSGSALYYQHFAKLWKKVFECGLGLTEDQLSKLDFVSEFTPGNRIASHRFVCNEDFLMPVGEDVHPMREGGVIDLNTSVQPTLSQVSECLHDAGFRVYDMKTVKKDSTYTNGATHTVNNQVSAYALQAA